MSRPQERSSIIYNGELYNYKEIRSELVNIGQKFRSSSDTEVVLAALETWGASAALRKFNWMGVIAWLDMRSNTLVLARDHSAEKPLYYYVDRNILYFASELKTLLTLVGRKFELNRDALGQYLFQGLLDASPDSFFQDIKQAQPGEYSIVDLTLPDMSMQSRTYLAPGHSVGTGRMQLPGFIDEVRETLIDSIRLRLRSDVPVGVLLSGGLDSSSIAAVAHQITNDDARPQLLSAISGDPRFDESMHIASMERHLGVRAHKVMLNTDPATIDRELGELNWINDAPISSLSALGHFRLMKRSKELGLKVILSGQGADELFLGYRKFLGFYLQSLLRAGQAFRAAAVVFAFLRNRTILNQFDFADAKRYVPLLRIAADYANASGGAIDVAGEKLVGWESVALGLGRGSIAERQIADIKQFSVPSLCHYEDRMSMANGREVRLPFLDSRLIDLAVRSPVEFKLRNGWTKFALRKSMESILPPDICWRRDKMGFSNPQGEWLKVELRSAVEDAFSPQSMIVTKGIVDSGAMMKKYLRYCRQPAQKGTIWYREIFAPFSLESWMRQYSEWIA